MFGDSDTSTGRDRTDHQVGQGRPSESGRSTDQPTGAGLKGAGRTRPKGLVASAWSLFSSAPRRTAEYPAERPSRERSERDLGSRSPRRSVAALCAGKASGATASVATSRTVFRRRATGSFLPALLDTYDTTEQTSNTEESSFGVGKDTHKKEKSGYKKEKYGDSSSRGQTSIDFMVGMSVFLLTVAFVVAFLPGIFEPFTTSEEGDVLASDRTASLLAEQLLAEPANPNLLDADCTAEFFDAAGDGAGGLSDCRFSTDADDLDTALGLGPATSVNVTIEENGTVRSVNGVTLSAGSSPPESESVVVSRRIVLLDGEESDLYVRLW